MQIGESGRSHFALAQQNENGRMPIYRVSSIRAFDYETTQHFDVPIACADGVSADARKSATSTIRGLVNDVNDRAPEFVKRVYAATIAENSDVDAYVTQVSAIDYDMVSTRRPVYTIVKQTLFNANANGTSSSSSSNNGVLSSSSNALLFSVNDDGVISVAGQLDRERVERVILVVMATDAANTSLFSTANMS